MLTKYVLGAAAVLCCVATSGAEAKRDPFMPSGGGGVVAANNSASAESLTSSPIMAYKLIGLVASEKKSIAIIQTRDHKNHLVKLGDKLGREGGIITDININGIEVKMKEERVELSVSNKQGGLKNEKK